MGLFRWAGRQLLMPITLRFKTYRDLGRGMKGGARALKRGLPGMRTSEAPLIPGTRPGDLEVINTRWEWLGTEERQQAWQEYHRLMPLIVQQSAKSEGGVWSLGIPEHQRSEQYARIQRTLRRHQMLYGAMLLIPSALMIYQGTQPIFWFNLLAIAVLLAPPILRQLVLRAQIYHGGKVSALMVFRRYPKTLPSSVPNTPQGVQTPEEIVTAKDFPMLCWLYQFEESSQ